MNITTNSSLYRNYQNIFGRRNIRRLVNSWGDNSLVKPLPCKRLRTCVWFPPACFVEKPGMVLPACNPSTEEAETVGSPAWTGKPALPLWQFLGSERKILSQKKNGWCLRKDTSGFLVASTGTYAHRRYLGQIEIYSEPNSLSLNVHIYLKPWTFAKAG